MLNIDALSDAQILALAGIVSDKMKDKAKGNILSHAEPDSEVEVEAFVLAVTGGILSIGKPTTMAPTSKLLSLPVLAMLLHRLGATRASAIKLLADILSETDGKNKAAVEAYVAKACPEAWAVTHEIDAMVKKTATPIQRRPSVKVRLDGRAVIQADKVSAEEAA